MHKTPHNGINLPLYKKPRSSPPLHLFLCLWPVKAHRTASPQASEQDLSPQRWTRHERIVLNLVRVVVVFVARGTASSNHILLSLNGREHTANQRQQRRCNGNTNQALTSHIRQSERITVFKTVIFLINLLPLLSYLNLICRSLSKWTLSKHQANTGPADCKRIEVYAPKKWNKKTKKWA